MQYAVSGRSLPNTACVMGLHVDFNYVIILSRFFLSLHLKKISCSNLYLLISILPGTVVECLHLCPGGPGFESASLQKCKGKAA